MDEKKVQQLQQGFMLVDTICANAQLNRAQHEEVKNALTLIAEVINGVIQDEQPEKA